MTGRVKSDSSRLFRIELGLTVPAWLLQWVLLGVFLVFVVLLLRGGSGGDVSRRIERRVSGLEGDVAVIEGRLSSIEGRLGLIGVNQTRAAELLEGYRRAHLLVVRVQR